MKEGEKGMIKDFLKIGIIAVVFIVVFKVIANKYNVAGVKDVMNAV